MSFRLLGEEGSPCSKNIETVCVLLETVGSAGKGCVLIDQVHERLLDVILKNDEDSIEAEVKDRAEIVCRLWRQLPT